MRNYLTFLAIMPLLSAEGAATAAASTAATVVEDGMIGKLTMSRLGNPKKVVAMDAPNAQHYVCDVLGIVRGVKQKELPNGDMSMALVGDFEGTNIENGQTLSSGILYLPSGLQDQLVTAFQTQEGEKKPIKFAIAIYTKKASNPAGYEYFVKRLVKEEADDPLLSLRNAANEKKAPQLAAPATAKKAS